MHLSINGNTMVEKSIETEVALIKKDIHDLKSIHVRLDNAIEKIADVSSQLHTIMAVHEEKLVKQEEALEEQEKEFKATVQELHTRITTNAKETSDKMSSMERRILDILHEHNTKETEQFVKLREELQNRVGILEKWRHLIIGGAIVIGFLLQKFL